MKVNQNGQIDIAQVEGRILTELVPEFAPFDVSSVPERMAGLPVSVWMVLQARADEVRERIARVLDAAIQEQGVVLSAEEQEDLYEGLIAEVLGYGPLQVLLADGAITEIMVNGPYQVFVERKEEPFSQLVKTDVTFDNDEHLLHIIRRILEPLGRGVDEDSPIVDVRLPDDSRVNVVIPPVSVTGPVLTIRKLRHKKLTAQDLLSRKSLDEDMLTFLQACVRARLNIVVAGNTNAGKTTMLNVLADMIPGNERIVSIENATEMHLHQKYVVPLESRPQDGEGKGKVSIRDLVRNAFEMRADRIVVGEVRGSEVVDLLRAMNVRQVGSAMFSVHAGGPRELLARLETLATTWAQPPMPPLHARAQIASAIDLIVHVERLSDGSRKVMTITEVGDLQGDVIPLQDIFGYSITEVLNDGQMLGHHSGSGILPWCLPRLRETGIDLPAEMFVLR